MWEIYEFKLHNRTSVFIKDSRHFDPTPAAAHAAAAFPIAWTHIFPYRDNMEALPTSGGLRLQALGNKVYECLDSSNDYSSFRKWISKWQSGRWQVSWLRPRRSSDRYIIMLVRQVLFSPVSLLFPFFASMLCVCWLAALQKRKPSPPWLHKLSRSAGAAIADLKKLPGVRNKQHVAQTWSFLHLPTCLLHVPNWYCMGNRIDHLDRGHGPTHPFICLCPFSRHLAPCGYGCIFFRRATTRPRNCRTAWAEETIWAFHASRWWGAAGIWILFRCEWALQE